MEIEEEEVWEEESNDVLYCNKSIIEKSKILEFRVDKESFSKDYNLGETDI